MKRLRLVQLYKITYQNGKIYIGQDRTCDINYFGSADSATIARDFLGTKGLDIRVRKQILRTLRNVTISEVNVEERKLIDDHQSNDPRIGYNRCRGQRRTILRQAYATKERRTQK
jgi:hypothetical protein